jgi:hypothetical protein
MIGAIVVTNEVDAKRWFGQLLPELTRFDVKVAWILDHCSKETKQIVNDFPLTVGVKLRDGKEEIFREKWRQDGLEPLRKAGCKWALLWDTDDTFYGNAPDIIKKAVEGETRPAGLIRRISIWDVDGQQFVRVDGPFSPTGNGTQTNRAILYNLDYELIWMDNVTHGPHSFLNGEEVSGEFQVEAYSIHWGLKDHELRKEHKIRWDTNYTSAIGRNPYKLWDYTLDESITPEYIHFSEWEKSHGQEAI